MPSGVYKRTKTHYLQIESARKLANEARKGGGWKVSEDKKHPGICRNTGKTHFKKGVEPWNKDTKGIMKAWNKGKKLPQASGENNPKWKGDQVTYSPLHHWIRRNLGKPETCINCRTSNLVGKKIHWANISGLYKRELSDYMRLCAKCHKAYDLGKLTLAEIGG
jgi:hypothetical protein